MIRDYQEQDAEEARQVAEILAKAGPSDLAPPVQHTITGPRYDWATLQSRFLECVDVAIVAAKAMHDNEIGDDPRAVAAMADTLFMERARRGV